jgi:hypothetical protein
LGFLLFLEPRWISHQFQGSHDQSIAQSKSRVLNQPMWPSLFGFDRDLARDSHAAHFGVGVSIVAPQTGHGSGFVSAPLIERTRSA